MKALISLALFIMASVVWAETPEQRARMYFSDIEKGKYMDAAGHFEPGQLKEFRTMMKFYEELPAEHKRQFIQAFFGKNETLDSIKRMNDSEFFAAILSFIMRQAEAAGGLSFDGLEILGGVKEGDSIFHLVTRNRIKVGAIEAESMEVVSLKNIGNEWRVLMTGKIKGLPDQLKAAFANARN